MDRRWHPLWHRRLCGRQFIRGSGGGTTFCIRLRTAEQCRVGRSDLRRRPSALLHSHRPGATRRGHELPLPAGLGLCRRRPCPRPDDLGRLRADRLPCPHRRHVDDGRSVPRNRRRDRCATRGGNSRGRNGGGSALCIRRGLRAARALPRSRLEPARLCGGRL